MQQMSLADVLPPTITVLAGASDRPRVWRVDFADGRQWTVSRTSDPSRVRVKIADNILSSEQYAWDVPSPAIIPSDD